MMSNRKFNQKEIPHQDVTTYEEKVENFKESFFSVINAHLQYNVDASPYPFYFFLLIEHLALLWYLVLPDLKIYQGVYFSSTFSSFLRFLNPHEYMKDDPNIGILLATITGVYLLTLILFEGISVYAVLRNKEGRFFNYLRKTVNYKFLITAKMLSGPLLGLSINLVYCDSRSPYHMNQSCFSFSNIVIAVVGGFIGFVVLVHLLLLALIYYIRNPLSSSYIAAQNRYYEFSKFIIKVVMPLYFAVDHQLTISIVYMFGVTGLWGAYIFWHRIFSVHTYNQVYFYVEYFMEVILFWISASSLIYHYAYNQPLQEELSFIYTLFSAMMVAGLMLCIQVYTEELFLKECLSGKVKKQNMEKITLILIHYLLNCPAPESRIRLRTYSKLLTYTGVINAQVVIGKEGGKDQRTDVYKFLLVLLERFLEENSSIMLKAVRCHLTYHLGLCNYAIHQSLELEEQRLSLIQEFMLFQFRLSANAFHNEGSDKKDILFFKLYQFHGLFGRFQSYVNACGRNNADYWQELCEPDPSLSKLRNLASLNAIYETCISKQYEKISELVPQSLHTTTLYLSFLEAVSPNKRGVLLIKEKLLSICNARGKRANLSTDQIKGDEEMSIITLDTIGSNLGVVINLNAHVKELLGFQKTALMGKNITRLMPKVYTELHNSFMLNFIHSQHANEASVKHVTALNSDSLLVDINLSVRILSNSQSELTIVGFMKKLPIEPNVGMMMYNVNNGDVLGIDENFVEIMNKRLSGKEVAQEEVRLNVLLPELKIDDLQRNNEQQTFLQVGSQLEEYDATDVKKKVIVRLKSIKIYQGVKLGFLHIVDIVRYQFMGSKLISSFNSHIILFSSKDSITNHQKNNTQTPQLSIHFEGSQILKDFDVQSKKIKKKLAIGRFIKDFVVNREENGEWWMLKTLYCICLFGYMGAALYSYTSHADYLQDQKQAYLLLNKTIGIANYFGQINIYASKIWNTNKEKYNCIDCSQYFLLMSNSIADLNQAYSDLSTTFSSYNYPLEYNQVNHYNLTDSRGINETIQLVLIPGTYANAFSAYISAANILTINYQNLPNFPNLYTTLNLHAIYIQENGKLLLPKIAVSAINKYYTFLMNSIDQELTRTSIVKSLMTIVIITCFSGFLFLAHKMERIKIDVRQIYCNLYLADVVEVLNKCNSFLSQRGLKTFNRQSIKIKKKIKSRPSFQSHQSQSLVSRTNQMSISHNQLLPTEEHFVKHTQGKEHLNTLDDQSTKGEANNEEALLIGQEQSQPTIKIEQDHSNSRIITIMNVFLIIFGVVIFLSYLNSRSDSDQLKQYIHRLKIIGEIKKSLNYIDYYALRIASLSSDSQTKSLLISEISYFFKLTQAGYIYLGDPQPILKDTYSLIQTIQQYLTLPNVTKQQIVLANYTYFDAGLQATINAINRLDSTIFYPQFVDEIDSARQNELIYTLLLIGLLCLTLAAIHLLHMRPVSVQSKYSLDMLRIIPVQLIERNSKALKLLSSM